MGDSPDDQSEKAPKVIPADMVPADNVISAFDRFQAPKSQAPKSQAPESLNSEIPCASIPQGVTPMGGEVIDFQSAREEIESRSTPPPLNTGHPIADAIGDYLIKKLIPAGSKGGQIDISPDFLQEHARPLMALFLEGMASNMEKTSDPVKAPPEEGGEDLGNDPKAEPLETAEAPQASPEESIKSIESLHAEKITPLPSKARSETASVVVVGDEPSAPIPFPSKKEAPLSVKKEISIQIDLGSIFRSLFKPPKDS